MRENEMEGEGRERGREHLYISSLIIIPHACHRRGGENAGRKRWRVGREVWWRKC